MTPDLHKILGNLPLNREERFWTATVLPALVAGDDFTRIGHFVNLLRDAVKLPALQPPCEYPHAILLSEYDRRKSDRYANTAKGMAATPDLIVVVHGNDPMIFGIEAKMFDNPSSVAWQLKCQGDHCLSWVAEVLRADRSEPPYAQLGIALVPDQEAQGLRNQGVPTITWTNVLNLGPGKGFYHDLLTEAIASYPNLKKRAFKRGRAPAFPT